MYNKILTIEISQDPDEKPINGKSYLYARSIPGDKEKYREFVSMAPDLEGVLNAITRMVTGPDFEKPKNG